MFILLLLVFVVFGIIAAVSVMLSLAELSRAKYVLASVLGVIAFFTGFGASLAYGQILALGA